MRGIGFKKDLITLRLMVGLGPLEPSINVRVVEGEPLKTRDFYCPCGFHIISKPYSKANRHLVLKEYHMQVRTHRIEHDPTFWVIET